MEPTTPNRDGEHPGREHLGGEEPGRDRPVASTDVLTALADRCAGIDASDQARALLAQVLAATLKAFTSTRAVRDPLPETAPGSGEEALAVLAGIDHLRASLAAIEALWQVAAEQRLRAEDRDRGVPAAQQGRGASHELGLARRISPAASSLSLASARRLVQHMPGMIDGLWDGSVAEQQASVVAGALDGASPTTCARIDEILREDPSLLQGKGRHRLRSDIDRMIQELEPEASRARAERAARARHVTMSPLTDGMARVVAVLRGIDAAGMMQALGARARSLKAGGERGAISAIEADLLVDAVLHPAESESTASPEAVTAAPRRPRTTPRLDVGVVITDTALLGRDDDAQCAQLEGYGVIPAHIVTDTLLGRPPGRLRPVDAPHPDDEVTAVFRRLYASPCSGELIGMESAARAFPTGLARMIRWRDSTCRTPWCNATIRHIDHVVPHHRGGPTSARNGQGLCVRCNLLKEHGAWTLEPLGASGTDAGPSAAAPPARPSSSPPHPRRGRAAGSPPTAWRWISPHGAQGISPTPSVPAPRDPSGHGGTAHDEDLGPPSDPAPA